MLRLENKVAIVTGASQGIGRSIAESLAREGAKVIAVDMNKLPYENKNIYGYEVNVTDRSGIKLFFDIIIKEFERIDILVNNAGITRDALIQKMTEEMWDLVIDVNLKGLFNIAQLVGPHMMENGKGSIINIASVVGEYGNVGQTNYAATKAGVIGMTKTWAKEFARKGANVRVNSVAPGYINTDMMKTVPEKVLENIKSKTMLGRLGEPEEIANAVLFLASDESSYVTGHNLSVNGGIRL
ncbi:beta-ketoacyl-ACP reductase [Clostridium tertium]|uniref:beta-ketoacyl-ACP reductase n=1 Tax=Clostridium tertium TaxID=1559 RepID=UPI001AE2AFA7|nr:beta-ketoacyl-ACP reductase [Clostridium tertium]MBP1867630.1 3-oxoacyl-[acyl-carrier protein] reductase [Clostridium tertium]